MKHEITPFSYNGHTISTLTDQQGEVWFIAKEVADILEYSDAYEMTKRLDEDEKSNRRIAGAGQRREQTLINESGLYAAILNCTKPEAKPFKKWVTSEVLPSIRKTGSYTHQKVDAGGTALDKLRMANALKLAEETAARICERFTKIGEASQQVIYAKIINPIMGDEVLMLPRMEEKLMSATEIGNILGITSQKVGRLANQFGMKTPEYGEYFLDKSAYSDKQVETFRYNQKAIAMFQCILEEGAPA